MTAAYPIYGHDWAVDFMRKSLANGRNRHATLITGAANIGKHRLAHYFAMMLNCTHDAMRPCGECRSCRLTMSGNHPDIIYASNDARTGQLKINAVREVTRLLALKPYDSSHRVALFADFDKARPQSQDALLKTLEEPPPHAILILLAQSTETILSTITSRCQHLRLRPVPIATIQQVLQAQGAETEQAALLARLSSGRIGWALNALHEPVVMTERADMLDMLDTVTTGNRAARFAIAEELGKLARDDQSALITLLETWQTYWRDVLLLTLGSTIEPCNQDRRDKLQQIAEIIPLEDAQNALTATRWMLYRVLPTNAHITRALEVMFLDYPGLVR